MEPLSLAGAGLVLCLTVVVGTMIHECLHAAVLYWFGIRCDINLNIGPAWLGLSQTDRDSHDSWGVVTPRALSPDTGTWGLRLAALAPLLMALPFVAVGLGLLPDPIQTDNLLATAFAIGWLACAIPSPQDFSVVWHTNQVVQEHTTGTPTKAT